MCIIALKTAGGRLTEDMLRACFTSNKDGAGYATAIINAKKDYSIYLKKGFFTFPKFYKEYESDITDKHTALVHFRIATHGEIGEDNCHPFKFAAHGHEYAVAHNGVLGAFSNQVCGSKSDTRLFVERVIVPLAQKDPRFFTNRRMHDALSAAIGSYNKVALLRDDAKYVLLNGAKGDWVDGVWFSNGSYKPWPRYTASSLAYYDGDDDDQWSGQRAPNPLDRWIDGMQACRAGYSYDPTIGENYRRGFLDEIVVFEKYSDFRQGKKTALHPTKPYDPPADHEGHKRYHTGWLWGLWIAAPVNSNGGYLQ